MLGNLEPEERILNSPDSPDDPWRGGKVYPVSSSTTKLLGDLSEAFYESGWSSEDTFEVQQAGTWKKDRFIVIKNMSIER
jgi:hypothetical protein